MKITFLAVLFGALLVGCAKSEETTAETTPPSAPAGPSAAKGNKPTAGTGSPTFNTGADASAIIGSKSK